MHLRSPPKLSSSNTELLAMLFWACSAVSYFFASGHAGSSAWNFLPPPLACLTTFNVPISNLVVTSSLKTVFPPYSLPPSSCLCTLYALNFIYHSTALIICLYGSYQTMRTGYKIFISVYPAYSLNTNGTPDSVCWINKWAKDQKEQSFWTQDNSCSFGNHTKK